MPIPYYDHEENPKKPAPMENISNKLARQLGRGLSIPLQLRDGATWNMKGGLEKIRQNIYTVLLTPAGRRILQPDFGSLLLQLVFEPWTDQLQRELVRETKKALEAWVPQIQIQSVEIDLSSIDSNTVVIMLEYTVKGALLNDTLTIPLKRDDSQVFKPDYFTISGQPVFLR